jgi:plasmid rolling circle replication initiator protein Rep
MHNNFNKEILNNQTEILSDIDERKKERPWRDKKLKTIPLAESYERLGLKKYYRVRDCGDYLEFKKFNDKTLKLNKANFCKVRLCPMCSWRREKKIFSQTSKIMNKALETKEYRFLFLTLTCKNVYGSELSNCLNNLFHGFKKLSERAKFKKAVKGWFRALEITHNLDKESKNFDTYHPHFHIILMVNKSYFTDPKTYLLQEEWTNLWKQSIRVDYTPIVNIEVLKTGTKRQTAKSVSEAAKYTVKDNDYIIPEDENMTDSAVMILDKALENRRLIAFGGELKKIHKSLNLDDAVDGDLIHNDDDELREDVDYIVQGFGWHIGYKQYIRV